MVLGQYRPGTVCLCLDFHVEGLWTVNEVRPGENDKKALWLQRFRMRLARPENARFEAIIDVEAAGGLFY
jgi:hypothetical protein